MLCPGSHRISKGLSDGHRGGVFSMECVWCRQFVTMFPIPDEGGLVCARAEEHAKDPKCMDQLCLWFGWQWPI